MITSYIQTLVREGGRVRTGPTVQSVLGQIISKMIGSTGEDVLIRQGGLSSTGFSYFLLLDGEISPLSGEIKHRMEKCILPGGNVPHRKSEIVAK